MDPFPPTVQGDGDHVGSVGPTRRDFHLLIDRLVGLDKHRSSLDRRPLGTLCENGIGVRHGMSFVVRDREVEPIRRGEREALGKRLRMREIELGERRWSAYYRIEELPSQCRGS